MHGFFTHYAGEGTIKSCKVSIGGGEEADLCLCRTKAHFSEDGDARVLTLDPVELQLADLTAMVQTVYRFKEGASTIEVQRRVLSVSNPDAKLHFAEYVTACYGTTEYPEDMTDITLFVGNGKTSSTIEYTYKCREESIAHATPSASAVIPQIQTRVSLECRDASRGSIREGYAFSTDVHAGNGIRKG